MVVYEYGKADMRLVPKPREELILILYFQEIIVVRDQRSYPLRVPIRREN